MSLVRYVSWFSIVASAAVSMSCAGGGSGNGGTGTSGNGGTTAAGLDGAWDITEAGGAKIGPSEMTVSGGVITGVIPSQNEGKTFGACKTLKDRGEFRLTFEGNALSGTLNDIREIEGSKTECSSNRNKTTPVSGSRASASAGAGLSGEWEVQVGDDPPFIVVIDGVTAKAWDKKAKLGGKDPKVSVSVAGGSATVASQDDDFSFAARKR
jgi:hypothetical protein